MAPGRPENGVIYMLVPEIPKWDLPFIAVSNNPEVPSNKLFSE